MAMKVVICLGVCSNPTANLLHWECNDVRRFPFIIIHHLFITKNMQQNPCENGLKWVKMGGNSNVPHPQCTRSVKTLLCNNKLVKTGQN